MDPSSLSILVLLTFGALVVGGIWLVRRDAERRHHAEQARWFEARARGWHYQNGGAAGGFTLRGESQGIHWEFAQVAGEGDSPARWRWSTAALTARGPAFQLLGRKTYEILRGNVGRAILKLTRWAARNGGGAVAVAEYEFAAQAQEIAAGSAAFRRRFALIGPDPDYARLIDAETEALLTQWPRSLGRRFRPELHLSAHLDGQGLRVELAAPAADFAAVEQVVRLGLAFAARARPLKR